MTESVLTLTKSVENITQVIGIHIFLSLIDKKKHLKLGGYVCRFLVVMANKTKNPF